MLRKILHIDMDAFYASVEQRDNPSYRGKPVIVGGRPEHRGVVAACSYEARKFGIHSAMPSSRAVKLCPKAIFLKPRFDAYREASQQIRQIFSQYTELIEPLSLDEAYLDVTEFAAKHRSATDVARLIKQQIQREVELTASAGVSFNKFLAKIASDMDKPDGLYVIRPHAAPRFIEQLEIRKFFGIGKVTEKKMHSLGIYHGADLKKFSKIQLQTQFGSHGNYYYNIARGIDQRPVKSQSVRKSISQETTFENDLVDKKKIWETLQRLAHSLDASLSKKELLARTVTLKVRYADFQIVTRSQTVDPAVHSEAQMLDLLPALLKKTDAGKRPIRLLGINLSNLLGETGAVTGSDGEDKAPDSSSQQVKESTQLGLFSIE